MGWHPLGAVAGGVWETAAGRCDSWLSFSAAAVADSDDSAGSSLDSAAVDET